MTEKELPPGYEKADYTTSSIPLYEGNPLVEALPEFPSYTTQALLEEMAELPERPHPQASRRQRSHWLTVLGSSFFLPLSRHVRLHDLLDTMIRYGYLNRFPVGESAARFLKQAAERQHDLTKQAAGLLHTAGEPISASVIGCSGTGKTRAVNQLLSLYPHAIRHSTRRNGWVFDQIVYLKVECPIDGSIKSLCMAIISEIDRITQENYLDLYVKHGLITTALLQERMTRLMDIYRVGVLVIDEIQNLMLSRRSKDELFNFIVSLSNTLGVPILYVGTPKITRFMQKNLRVARRFGSLGTISWDRMDREKNPAEWQEFIRELWKLNVLRNDEPDLDPKLEEAFYRLSQGIPDILIKLFNVSQVRAMTLGIEHLSPDLIEEVFNETFAPVKPMIEALINHDEAAIASYEDIKMSDSDFEALLEKMAQEETPPQKSAVDPVGSATLEKLKKILKDNGMELTPKLLEVLLVMNGKSLTKEEVELIKQECQGSVKDDPSSDPV